MASKSSSDVVDGDSLIFVLRANLSNPRGFIEVRELKMKVHLALAGCWRAGERDHSLLQVTHRGGFLGL
jgi:hypothetical protein